jgi:AcrR family transcriptional regulator
MPSRRTSRTPLSKTRVIAEAVALADADGIGALTMRRLADRLQVEPMSLYHHVANKEEILDGMVDVVFGEIECRRARTGGTPSGAGPTPRGTPCGGTRGRSAGWSRGPPPARPRCASTTP